MHSYVPFVSCSISKPTQHMHEIKSRTNDTMKKKPRIKLSMLLKKQPHIHKQLQLEEYRST